MQKHRKLGMSALRAAPLALGGNVFGWTADESASFAVLDAFVDAGFNLIDTADVYSRWVPGNSGGESETVLGKWFARSGKRDKIVLATKVGMDMGDGKVGLSPAYIRRAVEDSLRRLQTDRIDLYQSHHDDPSVPLADTLGEYGRLIESGKVRAIGASNYSAPRLAEALHISRKHGLPRYETLQPEYNLYAREDFERELEPVVRANHLGVITFYPLAGGFLTGKYRTPEDADKSPRGQSICEKYLNARGLRILAALDEVAGQLRATPAQVALAWQMARPGITAPLSSATSIAQLQELIGAAQLELQPDAMALLNEASAYDPR